MRNWLAARCEFPTTVLDLCYKEGCTDTLDLIIGSEGEDFVQECIELVERARDAEDLSDKRKWQYILQVMTDLRNLRRSPLRRPNDPSRLPNDIQVTNKDGGHRERSRSPTTAKSRQHGLSSSATATSFTCSECREVKNIKEIVPHQRWRQLDLLRLQKGSGAHPITWRQPCDIHGCRASLDGSRRTRK